MRVRVVNLDRAFRKIHQYNKTFPITTKRSSLLPKHCSSIFAIISASSVSPSHHPRTSRRQNAMHLFVSELSIHFALYPMIHFSIYTYISAFSIDTRTPYWWCVQVFYILSFHMGIRDAEFELEFTCSVGYYRSRWLYSIFNRDIHTHTHISYLHVFDRLKRVCVCVSAVPKTQPTCKQI